MAWSNSDASDDVMITQALLAPSFHRLLAIAAHFGLDRLEALGKKVSEETAATGYPEELKKIRYAQPIVQRSLRHMHEGLDMGAAAMA